MGLPKELLSSESEAAPMLLLFVAFEAGCFVYEIQVGCSEFAKEFGIGSVIGHWLAIPACWYATPLVAGIYGRMWIVVSSLVTLFGLWQTCAYCCSGPSDYAVVPAGKMKPTDYRTA